MNNLSVIDKSILLFTQTIILSLLNTNYLND